MMKDVSVIIVNYNTVNLLCDAVASVLEKTEGVEFEIIVVDNASSDNAEQIVADRFGENVRFLALSRNVGFGRANNEGIKMASGRYVFLLNPDTLLVNNAIKILAGYLDEHSEVGVCGGNLYSEEEMPATSYERYLPSLWLLFMECLHLYNGGKYQFNHTGKPKKVGYISGADMMIRREALEKAGVFDPDFFMYAEETELSYRIRKAGYVSISVPEAKIIHLEGKSIRFSERRIRMQFEGRRLYFRKRYGAWGAVLFSLLLKLAAIGYIVVFMITGKKELCEQWKTQLKIYRL